MARKGKTKAQLESNAREHQKKAFLDVYRTCGNISQSANEIGIRRQMHYVWLAEDEAYAEEFEQAHENACDLLEQEARRRAYHGIEEPVYQGGKLVGHVQKYSDTLLIFLMKGNKPEKYRDNVKVSADVNQTVQNATWTPPDEVLTKAAADFNRFMAGRFNGHHESNGHSERN